MREEKYVRTSIGDGVNHLNNENRGNTKLSENIADIDCPGEAEILSYCEGWIPESRCAQLDKHFAECETCIELLAVFALISNDPSGKPEDASPAISNEAKAQAEKVTALIDLDEEKFNS